MKFGKYNEDGSVAVEADECILTGQHVDFDNSIREKVTGTPYFYRVVGHQYHRVTDAHREYWAAHAGDESIPKLDAQGQPIVVIKIQEPIKVIKTPVITGRNTKLIEGEPTNG